MRKSSVANRLKGGARVSLLVATLVLGIGASRAALPPAGTPARPAASDPRKDPVIARVEGNPIRLSEAQEFQRRNMERYQKETGKPAPPAYDTFFLRIGLEEVVRQRLIVIDAKARGVSVSDAQAESLMKLDPLFRVQGAFEPSRFAAYRAQNPKGFDDAREQARALLLFQRRMKSLERELDPSAGELATMAKAKDLKARTRSVLVSDLQFDGVHDPGDEELRTYYQKHQDELARPAELAFTAATVTWPADAATHAPTRARAESLLAAASAGAAFESLLRAPGVVSSSGVWRPGAKAGLLANQAPLAESALSLTPGRFLPTVIEADDGFAIVRVDRAQARVVPPLSQIAVDLRARIRAEKIEAEEALASRRYFDAHPDSFATRAWQVRWAIVDSSKVSPRSPKEPDLRAWYDGHEAEFARLDPAGGGVQTRPFEEVREQVAQHWRTEDRVRETRRIADELAVAWGKGREGQGGRATTVGGPAWIVDGGALPDGLTRALADSARGWNQAPHALVVPDAAGYAVVAAVRFEPNYHAPFEVVAPRVRELAFEERLARDRAGARAWYESHLADYRTGTGYLLLIVTSPPVPTVRINVPADRIERYYREHLGELGTPPEVHVRHLLVMTDKRSDAEARELAGRLLARVRRGEDFGALARQFSEDPGSKDQGGDLGFVRRGGTVPAFERAAFALTTAQPLSGLVHTGFGYHIIQLLARREGKPPAFEDVRAELGQKLAVEYADTLARQSAVDLLKQAKTYGQLLALSEARQLPSQFDLWYEGQPVGGPTSIDQLRADLKNVAPKSVLPRIYPYMQQGYVIAALDSILPPKQLGFDEVKDRVLLDQQRDAGRRAARARADRLAHDLEAGVPWERAVETVSAEVTSPLLGRGVGLPSMGPVAGLDSLLFGPGADTLAVGGWRRLATPRGDLFVQLLERSLPEPSLAPAAREQLRATVLNRRMYDYIERLRERHPVQVLRSDLAERIPPPPAI